MQHLRARNACAKAKPTKGKEKVYGRKEKEIAVSRVE